MLLSQLLPFVSWLETANCMCTHPLSIQKSVEISFSVSMEEELVTLHQFVGPCGLTYGYTWIGICGFIGGVSFL